MADRLVAQPRTLKFEIRACRTCARRKVKCDRTPECCNRCKLAGFRCLGYEDNFVFVPSRQQNLQENASHRANAIRRDVSRQYTTTASTRLSRQLNCLPQMRDICINFALTNLFRQPRKFSPQSPLTQSWFELAAQASNLDVMPTADAIFALSAAYFGRQHRHIAVLRHSMSLYSEALTNLNHRLQVSESAITDKTLRDTMTLVVYEMIMNTTQNGWIMHADGLSKLFQLRGALSFNTELASDIFRSCRPLIVMRHMMLKKPCFLALSQWQNGAWLGQMHFAGSLYQLHALMCFIPGILSEAEILRNILEFTQEYKNRVMDLNKRIQKLVRRLFSWRLFWLSRNKHAVKVSSDCGAPEFAYPAVSVARKFSFDCLENANASVLYCAMFIALWRVGVAVLGPEFNVIEAFTSLDMTALPTMCATTDLIYPCASNNGHDMALEVCSMIEYHLMECHRSMGAFDLIYPIYMARLALQARPDLHLELSALLKWISDQESFSFAEHIVKPG
ncbi:Hypothetical protein R9X50_00726300 [Acrodontium crateriforme]|uniref:Zn(2)-C6 fungal-type domain-containing protein n=1 Tax=Acrodontium crateriforme TaxID=150365 RepID=A0AAQ3MC75_9PEZI|nr:Hypothetical protein R9X50_00726300 [Acrodontium crateriforme]